MQLSKPFSKPLELEYKQADSILALFEKVKLPENPYHPNPLRDADCNCTEAVRDGYSECLKDIQKLGTLWRVK